MNEHIIPLSDSHRCLQSVCGGKFAALAKIFSQDIPVPWGFSIGAEMYRNFLLLFIFLSPAEVWTNPKRIC